MVTQHYNTNSLTKSVQNLNENHGYYEYDLQVVLSQKQRCPTAFCPKNVLFGSSQKQSHLPQSNGHSPHVVSGEWVGQPCSKGFLGLCVIYKERKN